MENNFVIHWDLPLLDARFTPSRDWYTAEICTRCQPSTIGGTTLKLVADDTMSTVLGRYSSPNCPLCRVFWNALARFVGRVDQIKHFWFLFADDKTVDPDEDEDGEFDDGRSGWGSEGVEECNRPSVLKWNGVPNGGEKDTIGNTIELYSPSDEGLFVSRRLVPCDLETPEYWSLWRMKLDHCAEVHERPEKQIGFKPSRLLDLSPLSGPILVEDDEIVDGEPYAALSYCWGGADFIKTTTENMARHKDGIPMTALPILFQDVIRVTLRLGLRYLWIDSLCIIQGSKEDWEVQSSKMGSIFAESFVVLAAGASISPHHGLVWRRPDPVIVDTMDIPEYGDMPIYGRLPLEHPTWSRLEGLMRSSSIYLHRRGWCYQEYRLAARVLTLLPWETIFKCTKEIWCECGAPKGENVDDLVLTKSWQRNSEQRNSEQRAYSVEDERDFEHFWEQLVREYTSLDLTYHDDKLPALSGLAAGFQSRCGHVYLAGLWRNHLPRSLFWQGQLGDDKPFPNKPTDNSAPSWSWASYPAGVLFDEERIDFDKSVVLHAEVFGSEYNPYGLVVGGIIQLRVPVVPVIEFKKLCIDIKERAGEDDTRSLSSSRSSEFMPREDTRLGGLTRHTSWSEPDNPFWVFDSLEDVGADGASELYFAGFLGHAPDQGCEAWQTLMIRKTDPGGNTFKRVGIIRGCWTWEPWAPFWSELYTKKEQLTITLV